MSTALLQSTFLASGIDGTRGSYGLRCSVARLAETLTNRLRAGLPTRPRHSSSSVRGGRQQTTVDGDRACCQLPFRGPKEGVDPTRLDQSGWGIVFAHGDLEAPAIKEALSELLKWRQSQAGSLFRVLEGGKGYRPGRGSDRPPESKDDFLERFGVGMGPVDPERGLPYYLLLVGSPDTIPFEFQQQLDIQFAVGRLHFSDPQAYARYAAAVVRAEKGEVRRSSRVCLFGPHHPCDQTTEQTCQHLLRPLNDHLRRQYLGASPRTWELECHLAERATRGLLLDLLREPNGPALLLTAGHGLEFPAGAARQREHQGALLCQDWPGPEDWRGAIPEELYLAGNHLGDDTRVEGLVSFHFACYGAGTPRVDELARSIAFLNDGGQATPNVAERPFLASLPQQLLARGALAVVGHAERAWCYSFLDARQHEQTTTYQSLLDRLLKGQPLGRAVEVFNERYAELSASLTRLLSLRGGRGDEESALRLVATWTAQHDARSLVVLGDPAVRLAVAPDPSTLRTRAETVIHTEAPAAIEHEDWLATPLSVRRFIVDIVRYSEQLERELAQRRHTP